MPTKGAYIYHVIIRQLRQYPLIKPGKKFIFILSELAKQPPSSL